MAPPHQGRPPRPAIGPCRHGCAFYRPHELDPFVVSFTAASAPNFEVEHVALGHSQVGDMVEARAKAQLLPLSIPLIRMPDGAAAWASPRWACEHVRKDAHERGAREEARQQGGTSAARSAKDESSVERREWTGEDWRSSGALERELARGER